MSRENWEILLDDLYELGGYGEHQSDNTEFELDEEVDLVEQTSLSRNQIEQAAKKLEEAGIIDYSGTVRGANHPENNHRMCIRLQELGFNIAHDRQQSLQQKALFRRLNSAVSGVER